jgi:hypothetical protein
MVENVNNDFQVQPPNIVLEQELRQGLQNYQNFSNIEEEAWMKYIIEFHLPPDLEKMILMYIRPLINLSPKSKIKRGEIPMYLVGYDLIWDEYFIYMRKGKYDPELLVVKTIIREALKLQLCRSIGGWLGNLIHTKTFNIKSEGDKNGIQKTTGWFRRKKSTGSNEED